MQFLNRFDAVIMSYNICFAVFLTVGHTTECENRIGNKGGEEHLALGSHHCDDLFPVHWFVPGPDKDPLQPAPELFSGRLACCGVLLALEKPVWHLDRWGNRYTRDAGSPHSAFD